MEIWRITDEVGASWRLTDLAKYAGKAVFVKTHHGIRITLLLIRKPQDPCLWPGVRHEHLLSSRWGQSRLKMSSRTHDSLSFCEHLHRKSYYRSCRLIWPMLTWRNKTLSIFVYHFPISISTQEPYSLNLLRQTLHAGLLWKCWLTEKSFSRNSLSQFNLKEGFFEILLERKSTM